MNKQKAELIEKNLTYDELLDCVAKLMLDVEELKRQVIVSGIMNTVSYQKEMDNAVENTNNYARSENLQIKIENIQKEAEAILAKKKAGIEKRHDQPGGYRDQKKWVIDLLATGEFKTKRACAKAAVEKYSVTYETAIEYLNNQPNPYKKQKATTKK